MYEAAQGNLLRKVTMEPIMPRRSPLHKLSAVTINTVRACVIYYLPLVMERCCLHFT